MKRLGALLLLSAGCVYDLGRFPLVTSKTTTRMPYTVVQQGIEVSDCSWTGDAIGLRITPESIVAFALDRVGQGADALVDARVTRTVYPFLLIARDCMTVRGDAVRLTPGQ